MVEQLGDDFQSSFNKEENLDDTLRKQSLWETHAKELGDAKLITFSSQKSGLLVEENVLKNTTCTRWNSMKYNFHIKRPDDLVCFRLLFMIQLQTWI